MSLDMRKFLGDLSWSAFGGMGAAGILFLVNLLGGRWLGPEEYGKFQIVVSVAQILMIPMLFGFNTASARYIAEANISEKFVLRNTAFISVSILTLVFFLLFFLLSRIFFAGSETAFLSILFAVTLTFFFLARSFLQGFDRMKFISIADLSYAFLILVLFCVFFRVFFRGSGFEYMALSFLIGYIFFCGMAFLSLRVSRERAILSAKTFFILFRYGFLATLGSVAGVFLGSVDKLLLNYYFDTKIVGVYAVYILISVTIFSQLTGFLSMHFFQQFRRFGTNELFLKSFLRCAVFLLFVFLSSLPLASFLLLLFGKGYPFQFSSVVLSSLSAGIAVSYQIQMWFLNAEGIRGVKATVLGVFLCGILNLALNLLLIPLYSMTGALLSLLLSGIVLHFYFSRTIRFLFSYED
ncbi:MAG: oligosaccharide flippase family protein [Candidatus Moraniibacteriota bacterium]|nr:MAG: oligosaccharide flippase family protein [Candidatus Moranbacteria bacterium]